MTQVDCSTPKKGRPSPVGNLRQARFNSLVGPLTQDVFRYLCWLGCEKHLSEDITQEVLIRAWRSLDHLRSDSAVKSWLFTIARRERARAFSRKTLPIINIDSVCESDLEYSACEHDFDVTELRQAIFRLPPQDREPLVMQVLLGLETSEISETLNITRGAVLTRLHRARKRLITKTQERHATRSECIRKAS